MKAEEGSEGLRQGRVLRLVEEALEQGGVLSQEDLARALRVSARTVRRDVRALKAEGHWVPTRGVVKGVGRGQTHKVRVIELWLDREGYDKIARWVHHTPQAIERYVSHFLRVVVLHRQGTGEEEIAFVTGTSVRLVREYLALYEAALGQAPRREKLAEELARVSGWQKRASVGGKKGGEEAMSRVNPYASIAKRTFESALLYLLETEYGLLGGRRILRLVASTSPLPRSKASRKVRARGA